jgi:cathepsin L
MNLQQLILILFLIFISAKAQKRAQKNWREDQRQKFQQWKQKFNKSYATQDDEDKAMGSMLENDDVIEKHNQRFKDGKETFTRALWKRSDLSLEEKKKLLTGAIEIPINSTERVVRSAPRKKLKSASKLKSAPSNVNWTAAGLVQPVMDQRTCGGCYAFAATGVAEGVLLRNNISTRLSVQQIIDCNKNNFGCDGG